VATPGAVERARTGARRALGIRHAIVSMLAASSAGLASPAQAGAPLRWERLGPGVEHARLAEAPLAGHAFRLSLDAVALRIVAAPDGRARVDELAPAGDAIAINASFFDPDGKAMGLALDRGRSVGGARLARWGALVVERGTARVVRGAELPARPRAELVVQGLPRLVADGRPLALKAQRAARTAVCADGARVTFVVTTARIEANAFARALAAPAAEGGLGCRAALNLDGGPSTQLHARWRGFAAEVAGGWGVPNALVAVPRTP
jgi:hypothetical protein